MDLPDKCPIWGTPAKVETFQNVGTEGVRLSSIGYRVVSQRAGGAFAIDGLADQFISQNGNDENLKLLITTWISEEKRNGIREPFLTIDVLDRIKHRKSLPVSERAERLLKYFVRKNPKIGSIFPFFRGIDSHPVDEKNILYAETESVLESELDFLLGYLTEAGYLREYSKSMQRPTYTVTPKGFAFLNEIENVRPVSSQGFIAMWFDPSMDGSFVNGFEVGVGAAGYKAVRIDRKDHNNKIDDEIIAEIRRSKFLVADFTQGEAGARGGVYYEAGYARGQGIPVIYTCRKDCLELLHFDTRQFNHILWQTPADLADQLGNRISATIGDGPLKSAK